MPPLTRLARLLPLLLLAGLVAVVAPASQPSASATSTYHCDGYDGCRSRGYSDAGYGAVSSRMYWRMYGGHNCTNYVAYRMIQAGMSTERPWTGSGNAAYWGEAMSNITDSTPSVGAVAWWRAGVPGAGSSGHVAYVEKVVSPTEIVISEDSWGGTFHWRTITKVGTGWPSGFVHFVDKSVEAGSLAPRINGTPKVGSTLKAGPGRWKPGTATVAYQWLADNQPIRGATSQTLTLGAAQRDRQIAVRVTASKKGYTPASAVTPETADVAAGEFTDTAAPTVSGVPELDEVLTATRGTWSPAPGASIFRWKADGRLIKGYTGDTLTLGDGLVGKQITAAEVVTRPGYTKTHVDSAPTAKVMAGSIEVTRPFGIEGVTQVGAVLGATIGEYTPGQVTTQFGWLRDGEVIPGATAQTYQVTPDDLGHVLAVRVLLTRPRYRAHSETISAPTPITALSKPVVRATGRSQSISTRVSVRGQGGVPSGVVTVQVGRHVASGTLVDGVVRLVLADLGPGTRKVWISYAGDGRYEPSATTTTAVVKR